MLAGVKIPQGNSMTPVGIGKGVYTMAAAKSKPKVVKKVIRGYSSASVLYAKSMKHLYY